MDRRARLFAHLNEWDFGITGVCFRMFMAVGYSPDIIIGSSQQCRMTPRWIYLNRGFIYRHIRLEEHF